jgi:hypothetical protein
MRLLKLSGLKAFHVSSLCAKNEQSASSYRCHPFGINGAKFNFVELVQNLRSFAFAIHIT